MNPNSNAMLQVGFQAMVRFSTGKLRRCHVESILSGGWIALRPELTTGTTILKMDDEIVNVWDRSGCVIYPPLKVAA